LANASGHLIAVGVVGLLWGVAALAAAAAGAQAPPSCGAAGGASASALGRPTAALAWRAGLIAPTRVSGALPRGSLSDRRASASRAAPWHRSIAPRQASSLLVLGARRDRRGRCWLRVRLPWRPNEARGWLRARAVSLRPTPWRISISRAARTLALYRAGRRVRRLAIVVGAPATPTPQGLFSIVHAWRGNPGDFTGSWILGLTAHSDVLREFDGGNGQVGIHGRGGASLADPLGTAASHGCIRLANRAIDWLVRAVGPAQLPGIPVWVR
jgi:lipoprotein-anchoring transpeptidase ErfK/SrfK